MLLSVHPDPSALAADLAKLVAERAGEAITARGRFNLVLAGGSTPLELYRRLAAEPWRGRIDWQRTHIFFSDERCVAPDHALSNYGAIHRALLARVKPPKANIHRIRGEWPDPAEEAMRFEKHLRAHFASGEAAFDLVLLGVGADGHTASLFPGSEALEATGRLVMAVPPGPRADPPLERITLTLAAINPARMVMFLATGSAKAEVIARLISGTGEAAEYPAARVRPAGELWWHLDTAVAEKLPALYADRLSSMP